MILACHACDSRYDVTGHPIGQKFRCRCGTILVLEAPSQQAGMLACPHCGAGVAPTSGRCVHCDQELLVKACPRCLSRVFHGHKHCPECGAELSLAATGEANAHRPCPRCEHALHGSLVADVVIDQCTHCHGVFLDHIAIQRVVTDRRQARAEALLGSLPKTITFEIPPAGKMYIKCPMCRVVMNRKLFASGSGIIVDVCRTHGTFFDHGELPRIIEYVMQGGLERAEKEELERLRERARQEQQRAHIALHDVPADDTRAGALIHLLTGLFR